MSDRCACMCRRKRHYNSERRADEAAKASQVVYGVEMNSYPCPFCPGKWVVGNTYARNGKAARREREEGDTIFLDKNPPIGV